GREQVDVDVALLGRDRCAGHRAPPLWSRYGATVTLSILIGLVGLSASAAAAIAGPASMPFVTWPNTEYAGASPPSGMSFNTMKNWLPFVFAPAFAIATVPRVYGTVTGSSLNSWPGPPPPVPVGSPPWMTKSGTTRWKTVPS